MSHPPDGISGGHFRNVGWDQYYNVFRASNRGNSSTTVTSYNLYIHTGPQTDDTPDSSTSDGHFNNVGGNQHRIIYHTSNHGNFSTTSYCCNHTERQTDDTPEFSTSDGHFNNVRGDQYNVFRTSNHGNFSTTVTSYGLYDHPGRVRQTNDTPDFSTSDGHFSNVRGDQYHHICHTSNHGNFSTTPPSCGSCDHAGRQTDDTPEEQHPVYLIRELRRCIDQPPELEHGSSSGLMGGTGDDLQEVQRITVPIDVPELPSYTQGGSAAPVGFVEEQAIAIEHRTTPDIRQASSPSSGVPIYINEHSLRASTPAPASPEVSSSPNSDPTTPLDPVSSGTGGQEHPPNLVPSGNQDSRWSTVLDLLNGLVRGSEPNRTQYITFVVGDGNRTDNATSWNTSPRYNSESPFSIWLRHLSSLPSAGNVMMVALLVIDVFRSGNALTHNPWRGSSRRRRHRALSKKKTGYDCGTTTDGPCTLTHTCTFTSPPTKEDIDDCYAGSKEWIADEPSRHRRHRALSKKGTEHDCGTTTAGPCTLTHTCTFTSPPTKEDFGDCYAGSEWIADGLS